MATAIDLGGGNLIYEPPLKIKYLGKETVCLGSDNDSRNGSDPGYLIVMSKGQGHNSHPPLNFEGTQYENKCFWVAGSAIEFLELVPRKLSESEIAKAREAIEPSFNPDSGEWDVY